MKEKKEEKKFYFFFYLREGEGRERRGDEGNLPSRFGLSSWGKTERKSSSLS